MFIVPSSAQHPKCVRLGSGCWEFSQAPDQTCSPKTSFPEDNLTSLSLHAGRSTSLGFYFVYLGNRPVRELNSRDRHFPGGASGKEPACQCRRQKRHGFHPGLGRSPGGGHGNPLQYSCLENPMDRGAWQATVHRITKS